MCTTVKEDNVHTLHFHNEIKRLKSNIHMTTNKFTPATRNDATMRVIEEIIIRY